MPIYGYRCAACGHQKDVLQKMSDAPLTECPSCGEAAFTKEVSAPAFQLKGTGWYVTDFRDGNKGGKKPDAAKDAKGSDGGEGGGGGESKSSDSGKDSSSSSDSKSADSKSSDSKTTDKSSAGDKKASPAPASAPASKD